MAAQLEEEPTSLALLDAAVLSQTDEEYVRLTWPVIKQIIASDKLHQLTRLPSQLRAYRDWSIQIKKEWGSAMNFLIKNRLYWDPISSQPGAGVKFEAKSPVPFQERSDYRIIVNDWPYGWTEDITHICIWLKNSLPVDTVRGRILPEGRAMVDAFVKNSIETKLGVVGEDKVIWFKNHTLIQSIPGIDHVHVLIRGVDDALIDNILEKPPF